jgi:hypothetical protein
MKRKKVQSFVSRYGLVVFLAVLAVILFLLFSGVLL